jgi:hypothetical protein
MQARILITLWYDQTLPKPIGPIPPNWAPRCGYLLSAVQVHTGGFTEKQMGPAPPKVHPVISPRNNDSYSGLMVSFRSMYIYYS